LVCPHIQFKSHSQRNILLALAIDFSDKEKEDFKKYFPQISSSLFDIINTYYNPYLESLLSVWNKTKDLDPKEINSVIPQRTGFKILFQLKKSNNHDIKSFLKNMNNPQTRKNIFDFINENNN
jgi:hypothetical protein